LARGRRPGRELAATELLETLIAKTELPSARHYLLARTERPTVIHHRRGDDGAIATRIVTAGALALIRRA